MYKYRVSFFIRSAIASYMILMTFTIVQCMSLSRRVLLTRRQQTGVVFIHNVKYKVPFRDETTMPSFTVDNPADFLFLSHLESCECLVTAMVKFLIGILLQIIFWNFNIGDLFDRRYVRYMRLLFSLSMALLAFIFCENLFMRNWVNTFKGGLDGYEYKGHDVYASYFMIFIFSVLSAAYFMAVKNQREIDLTI